MPRLRQVSPAAAALAVAGLTQQEVAVELGMSQEAVSMMLSGKRPLRGELAEVVERLAGPEEARRILRLARGRERLAV